MSKRRPRPDAVSQRALDRIATARFTLLEAEAGLHEAVLAALATGATWLDIAEQLHVTRQAAHKRFARYSATRPPVDGIRGPRQ